MEDGEVKSGVLVTAPQDGERVLPQEAATLGTEDQKLKDLIDQSISSSLAMHLRGFADKSFDITSRVEALFRLLESMDKRLDLMCANIAIPKTGVAGFSNTPMMQGIVNNSALPTVTETADIKRSANPSLPSFAEILSESSRSRAEGSAQQSSGISDTNSNFSGSVCEDSDAFSGGELPSISYREIPHDIQAVSPSPSAFSKVGSKPSFDKLPHRRGSTATTHSIFSSTLVASRRNVYNLDALNTDHILQQQGLFSNRSSFSSSTGRPASASFLSKLGVPIRSGAASFISSDFHCVSPGQVSQTSSNVAKIYDRKVPEVSSEVSGKKHLSVPHVPERENRNASKERADRSASKRTACDDGCMIFSSIAEEKRASEQRVSERVAKRFSLQQSQSEGSSAAHNRQQVLLEATKRRSQGGMAFDIPMVKTDSQQSESTERTGPTAWRHCGLDTLRVVHEKMLFSAANMRETSASASSQDDNYGDRVSSCGSIDQHREIIRFGLPGLFLAATGVTPFSMSFVGFSICYGAMIALMFVLGHSLVLAFQDPDGLYAHATTAIFAVGSLCGLALLRMQRIENLLGPHLRPLEVYAQNLDFLVEWRAASLMRLIPIACFWASMVLSRIAIYASDACPAAIGGSHNDGAFGGVLGFGIVSAALAATTFCKLHICCGLEMSVDKFCYNFFEDMQIEKAIEEWNVVQAILRRSAATLDSCILAFSTSVLAALLWTGMGLFQGIGGFQDLELDATCGSLWCGWLLPPVLMLLHLVFRSAQVTEKCCRVPALVNSWTFEMGAHVDHQRHYVVQYIEQAAAGFYVKGVRLSTFMALKLTYLFGAIVFTLATQSITISARAG